MKILRIKLPEPTRFEPFTVSDYRDLLILRSEISANPDEEQQMFAEMLEDLYPQHAPLLREYIFVNVLLASIGKDRVEVAFTCPECGSKRNMILHLKQQPLDVPVLELDNIKITFKYPVERTTLDEMFFECIDTVSDGEHSYSWAELDSDDKDTITDLITFDVFTDITSKLSMINTYQTVTCCSKHEIRFNDALSIFKVIINPEEIFSFYKINHTIIKHDYTLADVMSMIPYERSIALTLIEKDVKNKDKGN